MKFPSLANQLDTVRSIVGKTVNMKLTPTINQPVTVKACVIRERSAFAGLSKKWKDTKWETCFCMLIDPRIQHRSRRGCPQTTCWLWLASGSPACQLARIAVNTADLEPDCQEMAKVASKICPQATGSIFGERFGIARPPLISDNGRAADPH